MLKKTDGFSFIELMITMAIFLITLAVTFEAMVGQKKSFQAEQELTEMSQNTRASIDILLTDLRMAGYKATEPDFLGSLNSWISSEYLPTQPCSVNLSSSICPIITDGGGTSPDMITLFMADAKESLLQSDVASGNTVITLDPNNSPGFTNISKFRVNDIIRLGDHSEFAKIIEISGNKRNILTIDTDPDQTGNQGLTDGHLSGEISGRIRKINVITYTVFNEENDSAYQYHTQGHPVLKRKYNEADYADVSEDVKDLQITSQSPPNYRLKLVTRTSTTGNYVSGESDSYKETEISADFQVRNSIYCAHLPKSPTIISITALDTSSPCEIHITWSPVTQGLDNETLPPECQVSTYLVTYDLSPGTRAHTYSVTGTSCDIDISNLINQINPVYYVSVAAINSAGLSNYSSEQEYDDASPPSPISDLSAGPDVGFITLTWTGQPECDVKEYHLYRSQGPGGPYTLIYTMDDIIYDAVSTYDYQDSTVVPCTTSYYVVRAFDFTYEGVNSNEASGATTDPEPPYPPTNFSFSFQGSKVNCSWNLSIDDPQSGSEGDGDVTGYRIYGLTAGNETPLGDQSPAGETSASRSKSSYTNFGIRAIDACGNMSNLMTASGGCQSLPIVTITSHSPGETVQDDTTIGGTVSSTNPLNQVRLKINDGAWQTVAGTTNWSYLWNTTSVENGSYTITVQAVDSESCEGTASVNLTVNNEPPEQADQTPPSFGSILQNPGTDPVPASQNVEICVRVTDASGISLVSMANNFSDTITITNPEPDIYCGQIPAHNGQTISYSITATDASPNSNQASTSSSYIQASASSDTTPPVIGPVSLTSSTHGSTKTITISVTITDASGIATAVYSYSGSGISGSGSLTNTVGNTYVGSYSHDKHKSCTVTIQATDNASPPNNANSSEVSEP